MLPLSSFAAASYYRDYERKNHHGWHCSLAAAVASFGVRVWHSGGISCMEAVGARGLGQNVSLMSSVAVS